MSRVKIKICGLTLKEQAIEIAQMGVDALGFILYPPSPRYLDPKSVQSILVELPPFVKTVGVFVDEDLSRLIDIMRSTGLDLAQLHGEETPEYCEELNRQGIGWVKAFRVKTAQDPKRILDYPSGYVHLDAWSKDAMGGTGKTFDWDLAESVAETHQLILSGGITPENVGEAIHRLKPYAIDVSSGVEIEPGVKSMQEVEKLLSKVKEAESRV